MSEQAFDFYDVQKGYGPDNPPPEPDPLQAGRDHVFSVVMDQAEAINSNPETRKIVLDALDNRPAEVEDRTDLGFRFRSGLNSLSEVRKNQLREALGATPVRPASSGLDIGVAMDLLNEVRRQKVRIRGERIAREEIAREDREDAGGEDDWAVRPLSEFDDAPLRPDYCRREDGALAFYRGKLNAVFGESESAKTWLALIAMVQVVRAGGQVMMMDFEDSGRSIRSRLTLLGMTGEEQKRFHYLNPATAPTEERKAELSELVAACDLVLIDATSEALAAYGLNSNSDVDVARFYADLPKWAARLGPAVVLIDHVPKSADNRSGQTGSQHKRAGVDGCSLYVERVEPFDHYGGHSRVWINKDKHAGVRATALAGSGGLWADLLNGPDPGIGFRIAVPVDPASEKLAKAAARSLALDSAIREVIEERGVISYREMFDALKDAKVPGNREDKNAAYRAIRAELDGD